MADIAAEYELFKGIVRTEWGATSRQTLKLSTNKHIKLMGILRNLMIGLCVISLPLVFFGIGIPMLLLCLVGAYFCHKKVKLYKQFVVMADQDPTFDVSNPNAPAVN